MVEIILLNKVPPEYDVFFDKNNFISKKRDQQINRNRWPLLLYYD